LDRILDDLGISHDFPLPLTSDQPGRQPKAGGDSDAGTKVS
jgi:hypothetical protein